MKRTALIRISVPEDAEDPITLVADALERYCGTTYPIWTGPLEGLDLAIALGDGTIYLEEETTT